MKAVGYEVELKFSCRTEDFAVVLAAAPAGHDETRELISVYFDTPDLLLQRAGASLRVREHKGRRTQTFKRGSGLVREEYEAPIESLAPDPALEPLPSMLPHGATLKPAFNVRVSRRQRTLSYRGAEIELALDQGEVAGGDQCRAICEVELELKSGPASALFALAHELSVSAPIYLAFDSKASQGQALVAGRGPDAAGNSKAEITADFTIDQAFQAIARQVLSQVAASAAALRLEAQPEVVHQLRVGVRRLRSALATFKPVLDGEGLERLAFELQWLGRACEAARNLDVFAEETLKPVELAANPASGIVALRKALDAGRSAAWAQACEAVASHRFRALMIDAAAWLETGTWRFAKEAADPLKPFARSALSRHLKKVRSKGRKAWDGDDAARHQLRIEVKKLRYAAEALTGVFGEKRAARYLRPLKDLQDRLGWLNDLATTEPMIKTLTLSTEAAFLAGELVGLQAAGKPKLLAQAAKALQRLEGTKPFWG